MTAQKDGIKDITSDRKLNKNLEFGTKSHAAMTTHVELGQCFCNLCGIYMYHSAFFHVHIKDFNLYDTAWYRLYI